MPAAARSIPSPWLTPAAPAENQMSPDRVAVGARASDSPPRPVRADPGRGFHNIHDGVDPCPLVERSQVVRATEDTDIRGAARHPNVGRAVFIEEAADPVGLPL